MLCTVEWWQNTKFKVGCADRTCIATGTADQMCIVTMVHCTLIYHMFLTMVHCTLWSAMCSWPSWFIAYCVLRCVPHHHGSLHTVICSAFLTMVNCTRCHVFLAIMAHCILQSAVFLAIMAHCTLQSAAFLAVMVHYRGLSDLFGW